MSTITTFEGIGQIPGTERTEPDENGWTSEGCWADHDGGAGDYVLSRVFETRYMRTLEDGRILVMDIAYYVETMEMDPDLDALGNPIWDPARMGPEERTHCQLYRDLAAFEESWPDFENYQYEHVGYLCRDSMEEYEAEALGMAVQDLRWALCWDGSHF